LHPAYESIEALQNLPRALGSDVFGAQFQQSPVPPGGAMIKRPWLRYYDVLPERTSRAKVIQSWDTAAKNGAQNDWSVCTTWLVVDNKYYLLDLTRGRYEYPQLRKIAIALAERFEPDNILIEDASTGIALAQELNEVLVFAVVEPIPIERDKIGRLYVQQAKFEAGRVLRGTLAKKRLASTPPQPPATTSLARVSDGALPSAAAYSHSAAADEWSFSRSTGAVSSTTRSRPASLPR
jgi:phage terminase large subunit-like protein